MGAYFKGVKMGLILGLKIIAIISIIATVSLLIGILIGWGLGRIVSIEWGD